MKVVFDLLLAALSYADIHQNQGSKDVWKLWMLVNKIFVSDDNSKALNSYLMNQTTLSQNIYLLTGIIARADLRASEFVSNELFIWLYNQLSLFIGKILAKSCK